MASLADDLWALRTRRFNIRKEIEKLQKYDSELILEIEKLQKKCSPHNLVSGYGSATCKICEKEYEDIIWDEEEYQWQEKTSTQ